MAGKAATVASRILALLLGLLWGFFVAFNAVFSDVFGLRGMLQAIVYVFVAYLGLGLAFGVLGPRTSWRWSWWLAAPGAVVTVLQIGDSPTRIAYVLGVLASVVAATWAGSWLGARARIRTDRGSTSGPGASE